MQRRFASRTAKESDLYPHVGRWMKRHFHCFKVASNVGLRYSRVDVLGIRDIGGDLSGDVETIAIEVKRHSQPFATISGQASGYRVYVNRVYLAEQRQKPFNQTEIDIAANLGIGLILIAGTKCSVELSSPQHHPITELNLKLIEKMALGKCQLCGTFFEIGTPKNHYAHLSRENLKKALAGEKGMMFWNRELADRKRRIGLRGSKDGDTTYERRFICPDCVESVVSQFGNVA